MEIRFPVLPRFEHFFDDWFYSEYLMLGGYGSAKSYHIASKLILKCLAERRKVLVVRETDSTHRESTFALFKEILENMGLLETFAGSKRYNRGASAVQVRQSPMEVRFPNGSKVFFRGMDDPQKLKSIHGVSIVWLEECSEIKYEGYKELKGRLRVLKQKNHFILSTNPVSKDNWVYKHFFERVENGRTIKVCDENELYKRRTMVKNNVYYHHSIPDDNIYLPKSYIHTLDEMKSYDYPLYLVARYGRFGPTGYRVLPQIEVATNPKEFVANVRAIEDNLHFFGMDFGFEESYNAVISCAVDDENKILYIYDEIYENKVTDDVFAKHPKMLRHKELGHMISADDEDPKAIAYYKSVGYNIRKTTAKFKGSRLSNTRKVKRFKRIIISPACANTIRELRYLTYAKKPNGDTIYDKFEIDPHTKQIAQMVCIKQCKNLGKLKCQPERKYQYGKSMIHVQRLGVEETKIHPRDTANDYSSIKGDHTNVCKNTSKHIARL